MTSITRPNLRPCPFCGQSPHWDWDINKVRCSKGHTLWMPVDAWNASSSEADQLRADLEAATMKRDILAAQIEAIRMRDNHRDAEMIERAASECFDHSTKAGKAGISILNRYANQLRKQAKESQP